jgi:hypothetical protein
MRRPARDPELATEVRLALNKSDVMATARGDASGLEPSWATPDYEDASTVQRGLEQMVPPRLFATCT